MNPWERVMRGGPPWVVGILNVTPDSFSDGGLYHHMDAAVGRVEALLDAGCDAVDIGGESTRPGAVPVSCEIQCQRVLPVIRAVRRRWDVPIAVDTQDPEVMRAAVGEGADCINDVGALCAPGALETAASLRVPVVLMHKQGTPADMQRAPSYPRGVVSQVCDMLTQRVDAAEAHGIPRTQIMVDPGFGFGKTEAHNWELLHGLRAVCELGCPVWVGVSRKSMFKRLVQGSPAQRAGVSHIAAYVALEAGARVVRTHDVSGVRDAVRVWERLRCVSSVAA